MKNQAYLSQMDFFPLHFFSISLIFILHSVLKYENRLPTLISTEHTFRSFSTYSFHYLSLREKKTKNNITNNVSATQDFFLKSSLRISSYGTQMLVVF